MSEIFLHLNSVQRIEVLHAASRRWEQILEECMRQYSYYY
jgi:hypothetical protein